MKEERLIDSLELNKEHSITANGIIPIDIKEKNFYMLMGIYDMALDKVYDEFNMIKMKVNELYGYDIISNITKRIKSPNNLLNKMKKKKYEPNYKNLIDNINDIAGLRVVCPVKSNIYSVIDIINKMNDIKVIKVKDYIKKPKKSGYSGYHVVVQTPVEFEGKEIFVKVEIQLRTMAMDFWATNEHRMKYKNSNKLSFFDSKKLIVYAKLLGFLDNKMDKIYKKNKFTYDS